jgi:hypothetical protein
MSAKRQELLGVASTAVTCLLGTSAVRRGVGIQVVEDLFGDPGFLDDVEDAVQEHADRCSFCYSHPPIDAGKSWIPASTLYSRIQSSASCVDAVCGSAAGSSTCALRQKRM